MDEFEKKLKKLQLAEPSEDLQTRIFGIKVQKHHGAFNIFSRRISFGWALSLSTVFLLLGFVFSVFFLKKGTLTSKPGETAVKIQIVETNGSNFMDFTRTSPDFLTGKVSVNIKTN